MTPIEAARDWVARGFLLVPVPFRQKAPVVNGWQELRLRAEDLPRYFDSHPQNIGVLLGDDSGTADIDCDCIEAVAAAAELAPPTGMCFGRRSKPASHYIYRSAPAPRFRKFVDPNDKSTIVELRCQKTNGTIGLQTVVPPSVHPSGEQIRFEGGADKEPGVADAASLTMAVTRIAAAALLARHWPREGSRHNAFLALAGILARAGWSVAQAIAFHRAIYRALWGGASELSASDSEVRSTFEKRSEAGEVTGFQTLAGLIHGGALRTALGWLGIANQTISVAAMQWPRIAPFLIRAATPLHVDLFPGFLGDMVAAVSQATETPVELPGLLGLGIVAACVARKVTVSPESGYEEPLNIFVAVGMESGNRKTAVLRKMAQPFVEWESREGERLQLERKRLLSERKTLEAQIEVLRKKAGRSVGDRGLITQIAELEAGLPEVPALPRLWVQDVTPEKLAAMMAEQGERIALLSDEGGVFDLLAGLYTKGIPNLDLFLQAHSGSSVRVDRGSRPPVVMQHPALTVAISPQPGVLQNLSDRPGFRGRGLLARFLYGLPASPLGSRLLQPKPVPSEVAEAYRAGIERLLALPSAPRTDGRLNTWQLRFSPDAYRNWKDFQRSIEMLMREGGKLYHLKDWASKLPGAAARIAGVMHCVSVSPEDSGIIAAAVMEQALNLCVILIDHAIAVFDLMQRDPVMEDAQRILRWIRREAKSQFSIRDCFCAHQSHFKKVDSVYPAIRLLQQHGYVQPAPSTRAAGRPTEIYLVNPQLAEPSRESGTN